MRIGFVPNLLRDQNLAATSKLLKFVAERGCEVLVTEQIYAMLEAELTPLVSVSKNIYADPDILVILGGDGTILMEGKNAAPYDTPLIGINLGRLGYLTASGMEGAEETLSNVIKGRYTLERRVMLEAELAGKAYNCLNEASIVRGGQIKMIDLKVCINGEYMDTFHADGVIVSTPTGSTAYNLSAGGPILKPDAEMFAITAVCPHALYARSSVIPSCDTVQIKVCGSSDAILSLDGAETLDLPVGTEVEIRRSQLSVNIIKTQSWGFYDVLRRKMLIK